MYSKNNNYNILPSNFYFYKREIVSTQGRSHDIFLKGGVTLCESEGTHRIVVSFSPPVVGCLLKKGIQRGEGSRGNSRTPLATALVVEWKQCLSTKGHSLTYLLYMDILYLYRICWLLRRQVS